MPQLLLPRHGGNSVVFALHRSWVSPVDGAPVTPSGDSLDITAFALLTPPPFLPLLHSLSSVSFTFQIVFFSMLVCFWETLLTFCSVSDNVLSVSHTWSHLLSFSEQNIKSCNAGNPSSIPGLGRSPGGGHGNPLQSSCLENPHGQRSLAGHSLWGYKELDMTEQLSTMSKTLSCPEKQGWEKQGFEKLRCFSKFTEHYGLNWAPSPSFKS